jgi:polyphosphate kinase
LLLNPKGNIPELNDNELYLLVQLRSKSGQEILSLIEVPSSTPRFVQIPTTNNKINVIFLEDIIRLNLSKIFSTYSIQKSEAYALKLVRDAEYELETDYSKSVLDEISKSIKQRSKGEYVRINFDQTIPQNLLKFLLARTKISDPENIIPGRRYHNKRDLMNFPNFGKPELLFPKHIPIDHPLLATSKNILDTIEKQDLLLHFPYQKFTHVLDILRAAAIDPYVRTIRITLYRVAKDSHILHALVNAAKNGKRVIVIVEVQARFDEEHNVEITRILQESGVIVIPGVTGLKVHCKLFQISRKQNGKTKRGSSRLAIAAHGDRCSLSSIRIRLN